MKIVVFTQRVEIIDFYNERRDCADQRISEFIRACGFIPVPIPNNPSVVEEIIDSIHPSGIVLTGGNSLSKYGGDAPERDETDGNLIRMAVKYRIPLYGFCRGMQSILDYFGNELVEIKGHVAVTHNIQGIEDDDKVNSYHNQACIDLTSEELIPIMRTDDGVIEKIKHKSLPIVGTMWHPEREKPFRKRDIEALKELMNNERV